MNTREKPKITLDQLLLAMNDFGMAQRRVVQSRDFNKFNEILQQLKTTLENYSIGEHILWD